MKSSAAGLKRSAAPFCYGAGEQRAAAVVSTSQIQRKKPKRDEGSLLQIPYIRDIIIEASYAR